MEKSKVKACLEFLEQAVIAYKDKELQTTEGLRSRCEVMMDESACSSCKVPVHDLLTGLEFYHPEGSLSGELVAYDGKLNMFFGVGVLQHGEMKIGPHHKEHSIEINLNQRRRLVDDAIATYKGEGEGRYVFPSPSVYKNSDLAFDENGIIYYLKEKFRGKPFIIDSIKPIYSDFIKVLNYYGTGEDYKEISIGDFLDYVDACDCRTERICCEAERLILLDIYLKGTGVGYELHPVIYKRDGDGKYIIFNLHEKASGLIIRSASQFEVLTLFEDGKAFD